MMSRADKSLWKTETHIWGSPDGDGHHVRLNHPFNEAIVMKIKCEICGKTAEIAKKNVSFYARWLEIEPDRFICRDCERRHMWPNMIQYKLPGPYQDFKKVMSEAEKKS